MNGNELVKKMAFEFQLAQSKEEVKPNGGGKGQGVE